MKHLQRDIRKTVALITIVVFVLFSFAFALVPVYRALSKLPPQKAATPNAAVIQKQHNS